MQYLDPQRHLGAHRKIVFAPKFGFEPASPVMLSRRRRLSDSELVVDDPRKRQAWQDPMVEADNAAGLQTSQDSLVEVDHSPEQQAVPDPVVQVDRYYQQFDLPPPSPGPYYGSIASPFEDPAFNLVDPEMSGGPIDTTVESDHEGLEVSYRWQRRSAVSSGFAHPIKRVPPLRVHRRTNRLLDGGIEMNE